MNKINFILILSWWSQLFYSLLFVLIGIKDCNLFDLTPFIKLKVIENLPVNTLFIISSLTNFGFNIFFLTQNCCPLHSLPWSNFPYLALFVRNLVKLASMSECSQFPFCFCKDSFIFLTLRYGNMQHTGNWNLGLGGIWFNCLQLILLWRYDIF